MSSLQTRIHLVPAPELPAEAPDLIVTDAGGERSIPELFRLAPHRAPAGRHLRLFLRAATVNSPDRLEVVSARREDGRVLLDLELRVFEGLLGANVQASAVVEVTLGSLEPGSYELAVSTRRLGFHSIGHPEQAEPRETSARTWTFEVKASRPET